MTSSRCSTLMPNVVKARRMTTATNKKFSRQHQQYTLHLHLSWSTSRRFQLYFTPRHPVAECREEVYVGCTFVVIVVLHRRSACWSFSLKILEAGKARLSQRTDDDPLVASCERHVHSATIDVGASIAPTNAEIEKFAAKAESTVKMWRRTLANMRLSFFNVVSTLQHAISIFRNEMAKNPAFSQKKNDTRNLNNVAATLLCCCRCGSFF